MTAVKIKTDGQNFEVDVQGHAGLYPGRDPLCAAVSTLTYTLIQTLRAENNADNLLTYEDTVDEKDAHWNITCTAKPETAGYVDAIVSTIASGFALLANKYDKNVRFVYEREEG